MEIPSKQLAGPLQSSGRGSAKRDLAVVSMWMKRVGCRLTQERSEGAFLKKAYGGGGGAGRRGTALSNASKMKNSSKGS